MIHLLYPWIYFDMAEGDGGGGDDGGDGGDGGGDSYASDVTYGSDDQQAQDQVVEEDIVIQGLDIPTESTRVTTSGIPIFN